MKKEKFLLFFRGWYVPLVLYAGAALFLLPECRYFVTCDGIVYLRHAHYLAAGTPGYAITGYWSPLLSCCIAPFIRAGMEPFLAARTVLLIGGGVFVLAVMRLSLRLVGKKALQTVVNLVAAFCAALWTMQIIVPDIIAAAFLCMYFSCSLDVSRDGRVRTAVLAGLIAGAAYLAKTYMGVFFLVHYPFTLLNGHSAALPGRPLMRSLLWGYAAFLLAVLPWITLISLRAGQLTIGSSGVAAHTLVGPPEVCRFHPTFVGLHQPPAPAVHSWEDPFMRLYPRWSPFTSQRAFDHQLVIVRMNIQRLSLNVTELTGMVYWLSLAAIVLSFLSRRKTDPVSAKKSTGWLLGSVGMYVTGLLFVYSADLRYLYPVFPLLLMTAAVALAQRVNVLVMAVLLSTSLVNPVRSYWLIVRSSYNRILEEESLVFRSLRSVVKGAFAVVADTDKDLLGCKMAYTTEVPCLGSPIGRDVDTITKELALTGTHYLVLAFSGKSDTAALYTAFQNDQRYRECASLDTVLAGRSYRVFFRE